MSSTVDMTLSYELFRPSSLFILNIVVYRVDNKADVQKYNLLLFFSFYYPKCGYGLKERERERERERGSKTAEMHTRGWDANLQWTDSSPFSFRDTGTGPSHDIESS